MFQVHHEHAYHIAEIVSGYIGGGASVRFLVYVSKSLPALPDSAGWWAHLFYNMVKNTSGLDPNAMVTSPTITTTNPKQDAALAAEAK